MQAWNPKQPILQSIRLIKEQYYRINMSPFEYKVEIPLVPDENIPTRFLTLTYFYLLSCSCWP